MKLFRGIHSLRPNTKGCVATIGNFDGLHLGHQKVINILKDKAKQLDLPLVVISFEPLPAEYFMPTPPTRIYSMRDKVRLLNELGVDQYLCLSFDEKLANMSPKLFVERVILNSLNTKYLAVGDDFRFGHNREGDFQLLLEMGDNDGMQVSDTSTCSYENQRVSSTRIRKSLEAGNITQANNLLGHSYQISGRIRHGDKRGRTIGFPTLNMKLLSNIAPKKGVYAVKVHGLSRSPLLGVANLGNRPTVGGLENRLETHLFDFDKNVYGQIICVELIEFIREEKKFNDFEALKAQILLDANKAKSLLTQ